VENLQKQFVPSVELGTTDLNHRYIN